MNQPRDPQHDHRVITSRLGMLGMFCATSSPGMGTALMLLGGGEGDLQGRFFGWEKLVFFCVENGIHWFLG